MLPFCPVGKCLLLAAQLLKWEDRVLTATGLIKDYRGKPQIVLDNPQQVIE